MTRRFPAQIIYTVVSGSVDKIRPSTPRFAPGRVKSFRMSKHDLQARPIYHRKRDSIEAHLTIVFAALAVSRWIEATTGWSIRKFV